MTTWAADQLKADFDRITGEIEDRIYETYTEVQMHPELDAWGRKMAAFCARKLDIDAPRVRWFRKTGGPCALGENTARSLTFKSQGPILGKAQRLGNEIWVMAGRPIPEMLQTIAHECRHLSQIPSLAGCEQNGRDESNARAWAAEIVRMVA